MSLDVIGIGNPVIDCLSQTDQLPHTNELVRMHDFSWQGGGKVSTAIVAASCLGAKTGMIGTVGDDAFGQFILNDFMWNGVDVSHIAIDSAGTTTTFAIVISELMNGGRSFIGRDGTCRELTPNDLDEEYIASAKYLLVTDMTPIIIEAVKIARKHGVKIVIDADLYTPEIEQHINLVDIFIASEYYYNSMFKTGSYKDNCQKLLQLGPEIAVITLGANGSVGADQSGYYEIPAFHNINVIDTTGAGDVYHGAFVYGMLQNWSTVKIARFASAVSAIKCTRLGGRAGLADMATVVKFIEEGIIDDSIIDQRVNRYKQGFFGPAGDEQYTYDKCQYCK